MKILLITHEYTRSGGPISLFRMTGALKELRPDWHIEVLGLEPGPLRAEYRDELLIPAHEIVLERDRSYHYQPLLEKVQAIAPDVVLLNGITLYQEAIFLRWMGIRSLWWVHDGIHVPTRDGYPFTLPELEVLTRLALEYADRYVFSARDTMEQYEAFCPSLNGKSTVIPYGFDGAHLRRRYLELKPHRPVLRRELGFGEDDFVFLCVGAIQKRKNQLGLTRAFVRFAKELSAGEASRCRLAFLGGRNTTDPEAPGYELAIRQAIPDALTGQVHFLGMQPSSVPYFVASDAHALVSTNECSPLANVESMLCEVPCISSAVHGIPETVQPGLTGFLVDPAQQESIARTLREVHDLGRSGALELAKLKEGALKFALDERSVESMARRFAGVFEDMVRSIPSEAGALTLNPAVQVYLQEQMALRWRLARNDAAFDTMMVRHHARRFLPDPPSIRRLLKKVVRRVIRRR
ncbi:MAG: glycosyltransferase family 4 protein [Planctomycetota bacterium]